MNCADDCVEWDVWVDLEQPSLLSRNDVSTLQQLQAASMTCRDPVAIQCRTATPDKTDSDLTGQHVRCNLWDGLVCSPANVSEATCFNYEARLGCLRRTSKCRKYLVCGSVAAALLHLVPAATILLRDLPYIRDDLGCVRD